MNDSKKQDPRGENIRVLIVDDHPVVRVGIATIIDTQPDMTVVAEAESENEAVELFRRHLPDITVMDLRLDNGSGVECIRRIRSEFPDARFVVLTTYHGDEDIHQALTAGASGYLIKGMPRQLLLDALRRVCRGERYLPPVVAEALAKRKPLNDLSHRESEVLSLLATGKSNKEIADALCIAEITVKCHLSMIFARLGVTDRTQAIVVAAQRGLIHLQ
jgi:DNA-binding NarL/FixJ family response regulator